MYFSFPILSPQGRLLSLKVSIPTLKSYFCNLESFGVFFFFPFLLFSQSVANVAYNAAQSVVISTVVKKKKKTTQFIIVILNITVWKAQNLHCWVEKIKNFGIKDNFKKINFYLLF